MQIKIKPNKDIIPIAIATIVLIIIGGGCQSTFDFENYYYHYIGTYSYNKLEIGYQWLESLFFNLGLSYISFRILIIAFFVITFTIIAYRYVGKKIILIDLLYLFYCFPFDLVNLRNTIANSFFIIGFFACMKFKHNLKVCIYVGFLLIATLFHTTSIVYLIFVYALIRVGSNVKLYRHDRYKLIASFLIFGSLLLLSSKSLLVSFAGLLWSVISNVFAISSLKKSYLVLSTRWGWTIYSLCHIAFTITIAKMRMYLFSYNSIDNNSSDFQKTAYLIETVYLCNILLFTLLPLLRLSTEMYRFFRGMVIVEYIAYFASRKFVVKNKYKVFSTDILFGATFIINFAVQIAPYFDTIFKTMFTTNRYFEYFY